LDSWSNFLSLLWLNSLLWHYNSLLIVIVWYFLHVWTWLVSLICSSSLFRSRGSFPIWLRCSWPSIYLCFGFPHIDLFRHWILIFISFTSLLWSRSTTGLNLIWIIWWIIFSNFLDQISSLLSLDTSLQFFFLLLKFFHFFILFKLFLLFF